VKFPTLGGTTARHPAGSDLTASTSLPLLAGHLVCGAKPTPVASSWTRSATVTVASEVLVPGKRTWLRSNWRSTTAMAMDTVAITIVGEHFAPDHELSREPWASLTLVDE
jgi:hypothetical protein